MHVTIQIRNYNDDVQMCIDEWSNGTLNGSPVYGSRRPMLITLVYSIQCLWVKIGQTIGENKPIEKHLNINPHVNVDHLKGESKGTNTFKYVDSHSEGSIS